MGSLDQFMNHLNTHYKLELSQAINELIPVAEKRKSKAINSSPNDFLKMKVKRDSDEMDQSTEITIELFPSMLPKSCHRFSRLSKGKAEDKENPGYVGSKVVRV